MSKRVLKFFAFFGGSIAFLAVVFYSLIALFYTDGFTYNTWINGVYCTGKNVSEVNSLLIKAYDSKSLVIESELVKREEIPLSEIDYEIDFTKSLNKLYKSQKPWLWGINLFKSYDTNSFEPSVSYSEEMFLEKINSLSFVKKYSDNASQVIEVRKEAGLYYLYEDVNEILDVIAFAGLCREALSKDLYVYIPNEVFGVPEYTEKMLSELNLWDKLSDFLETRIYYDMGDEIIPIDERVLASFVVTDYSGHVMLDENGEILINDVAIERYIDELCDKYDTYQKPRTYVTFSGEEKYFEENNYYGTQINRTKEKEFLKNAVHNKEVANRVPVYKKTPYHRGLNDLGNEVIEIDLTYQKLYYIVDGEIKLESKIVSGNPNEGNATPEMMCSVYKMNTDTYLTGPGYKNHVDYWMAIHKKIGIHDASWQSSFGGTRYLKHGSHGCINMPASKAKALYELIKVGVPVVVYK